MAALRENRSYGLSRRLSRGGSVSVFHVRLTDSAATAIDRFRNGKGWSAHPTISFRGNRGSIAIPCSETGDELRIFTFGLANVASDRRHGTFDCVQQLGAGRAEELSALGVIQKKLKVDATDDSYEKARQSMAQVEEETRSQGAIVIKGVGRQRGKKVTTRGSGSETAAKAKPVGLPSAPLTFTRRTLAKSKQKAPAPSPASRSPSRREVQERPLKERVIHLLVLRPYKRSELLLRLQKDGLTDGDGLDAVLAEVGELSRGDSAFVLRSGLFKDVRKDWPGYTAGELQLLKRILVRRLFEPQHNLLTVPHTRVSPLRETPNSSPVHQRDPSKPEAYTDPLVRRRPRISHLSTKTATELPRAAKHATRTGSAEAAGRRSSLVPRKLFGSKEGPQPKSDRPPSSARGERPRAKRKRSGERGDRGTDEDARRRGQSPARSNVSASTDCTDPGKILLDTSADQADADFLLVYSEISSQQQRQSYKQEFNRDYSEYRLLHARIDSVTQQFMELNTQLQQLSRESCKYKEVHDQIIQAYQKIKKSNPDYQQEKLRCEYLHNKLAHIKKLISAYDQQRLLLDEGSVGRTQK